jgi:acyl transferase domain-containing protein/acyl carrier protein/ubiquinone/menaquinone biosynthesis C-methylase UbiE
MRVDTSEGLLAHEIAIVGMAGKFPGADNPDELWSLLMEGRSTVEAISKEKHGRRGLGTEESCDQNRWWGNFLQHPEHFDHEFFRIPPREAQVWDPQQRILLEVAYQALESSGYFGAAVKTQPHDYGCYIGAAMNNYYDNVACHEPTAYATVGTSRSFTSGVLSHFFGWSGPAVTLDTACSSSLVAINAACRAIAAGECSRAIAGGTNIITSPHDYRNLAAAGFLSPTGQCKPFDACGDGYCRAEGVGLVVLKSLSTAIEENDHILGIIASSAVSQSRSKNRITVPDAQSQVALHRRALHMAGLGPDDVSYVEAHGTGTSVGDPIEMGSIREAFCQNERSSPLYVASIKGNIGHSEASAGVAGLMKVLLMMSHDSIPKQVNHTSLSPRIPSLDPNEIVIPRQSIPWRAADQVACVTSYGATGSNAILLVRAAQRQRVEKDGDCVQVDECVRIWPLHIAAASEGSLVSYCSKLLIWVRRLRLEQPRQIQLPDILFNIADKANHSLPWTMTTAVSSLEDLEMNLSSSPVGVGTASQRKSVILVFAGQTRNFVGLSPQVAQDATIFGHNLDLCHQTLIVLGHKGIYPTVFQTSPVRDLVDLHAALFATQYSCAKSWIDSGLKVDAVVGHSFGQLVALCISGVLSLPDALKLVIGRASLMQKHWGPEPGCMLSVHASRERLLHILSVLQHQYDYAEIACHNSPDRHVVVGSTRAIAVIENHIECTFGAHERISKQKLAVSYGFHSLYTDGILHELTELARELQWRKPSIHLEACHEGPLPPRFDHDFVASHVRQPVFFWQAIKRLAMKFSNSCWLSAGVDAGAIPLVKWSLERVRSHSCYYTELTSAEALDNLAEVTINLWKQGQSVQYWPFHRCQRSQYRHMTTPRYSFDRHYHWLPFKQTNGLVATTAEYPRTLSREIQLSSTMDDASSRGRAFAVSHSDERFRALCDGHVMSGNALAPASLHVELAVQAAIALSEDTAPHNWAVCVEQMVMPAGLVLGHNATIDVRLEQIEKRENSWRFQVTSRTFSVTEGSTDEVQTYASGLLYLQHRGKELAPFDTERSVGLGPINRHRQIVNDPTAESMQGRHIYQAFKSIVAYGMEFHSVKSIECIGTEAAGMVQIASFPGCSTAMFVADTIAVDAFMQPAGFLANYFAADVSEEWLHVCESVGRIEVRDHVAPGCKYYFYASMRRDRNGTFSADVCMFDSRDIVFCAISAITFTRVRRTSLARNLGSPDSSAGLAEKSSSSPIVGLACASDMMTDKLQPKNDIDAKIAIDTIIFSALSSVTGIPRAKISWDASFEDIGCDSLAVLEVIKDIRASTSVTVPLATFLAFESVGSLVQFIAACSCRLDSSASQTEQVARSPRNITKETSAEMKETQCHKHGDPSSVGRHVDRRASVGNRTKSAFAEAAYNSFLSCRLSYDSSTVGTKGYCEMVLPAHRRIVQAYAREALNELGVKISTQGIVDDMGSILPCHYKLVQRFLSEVFEGREALKGSDSIMTRSPVAPVAAGELLALADQKWPEHKDLHTLMGVMGSRLAECLMGRVEGLEVLFGIPAMKRALESFYKCWPLFQTPLRVLTTSLDRAIAMHNTTDTIRILEVGAGTGGATSSILATLRASNARFSYCFTDISPSLVHAARDSFSGNENITFAVLDIEQEPTIDFASAFDLIIGVNCVHATQNLSQSLRNLRTMLREDGALTLIEITKPLPMFDLIFGSLQGWWLFNDGREHPLVDERHWERQMLRAGFDEVVWSEGRSPESKIVRTIAAFPPLSRNSDGQQTSARSRIREVTYKTCDGLDLLADVYCPISTSPGKALPVGGWLGAHP